MADGYRCIIVMCLLLFPPYRKYCSHVDEKKIESLALLENDLSTFKWSKVDLFWGRIC